MNTAKEPTTSAVPPPCSAQDSQDRDACKDSTNNFNRSRCQFTYSDGRRCSNERASLCAHHASRKRRSSGDEVAPDAPLGGAELEALCSDLTTATNINRALAQVFLLTAQGRISQKQAVAFGYLSQLLLQTVPGIRSEFVSAFGYHPWQENLTTKLKSSGSAAKGYPPAGESHGHQELSPVHEVELSPPNDDPDDSGSSRESLLAANVYHPPQKGYQQDALFAGDKVELCDAKEDHELSRVNVDRRPFEERVMEPDYDSIVSRGRDLLAGKYSVTPEGRREAQALNTELELMQPPAAKMPKGARASIIEHMKRWIAQKRKPAAKSAYAANMPLGVNYYGHPIPMAIPYDEIERGAKLASRPPSRDADFASPTPSRETSPPTDKLSPPPNSEISTLKSPVAPVSPPSSQPSASAPAPAVSSDPPPTRRPKKPRRSAQGLASESSLRPSPPTFAPELALASNPPNSTAHTSDWYTPPAWSKNCKPDPFPSRNEKRKRELRGMSNSKLRHLQHLNSRAF